jgi:hypothetical protein
MSTTEETSKEKQEIRVPLSGEAIRTMNYVDDISVTLRRILSTLPSLTPEERQRVAEHIKSADPSYETVVTAMSAK